MFTWVAFKKTSMLHEQKLQSLHCRDRRVQNTKLNWSTVIASVPLTEWLFKYSVSKPPKVLWIVSLLIWKHSVNLNLVSLLVISFHSFLTQTAAIFRLASVDAAYTTAQGGRWIATLNKNFWAPIFTKYATSSRDLLQSYLETGSRPTFLNHTYLI